MTTPPLRFTECLSLIDDRSAALRAAAIGADLTAGVPGCPAWSLRDLVAHVGEVQRFWAAAVVAGPAGEPPWDEAVGDTEPPGDLLAWSAESTELLLAVLRAAGPEAGCWTWWAASGAPSTVGAVARHQVQEAAVHAFDAQSAAGRPEPLPTGLALDGVPEFLTVGYGSMGPWPHSPAQVTFHADEGPAWPLTLGSHDADAPTAHVHGPASDLVLALYGRLPLDLLRIDGDLASVDRLISWPPLG